MTDPCGPPYHPGGGGPAPAPSCVRHPDRATGVRCVRCDRPSCPECLREASVGFQCVDCVAEGARTVRSGRTVAGAALVDRPLVVPGLIAINTLVFVWTVAQAGSVSGNYAAPVFEAATLAPRFVAAGEWWRLLTSGFLHFGPIHLLFNMLALWVIGRDLELVLGRARFLMVYLCGLLGGSAAAFVFGSVNTAVAGASGAVFGLMGGLALVLRRMNRSARPALSLIAVNLVISFVVPNISILGHLGGLVAGAAATAAIVYAPARGRTSWQAGGVAALVAVLLLVMAARAAALG